MRWRVTYDLTTTVMNQYGRNIEVDADTECDAETIAQSEVMAQKQSILDARHDLAGENFTCIVTRVIRLKRVEREAAGLDA